ncbi:MAG: PTS transporter subunit EIIA [Proteobacteria bacterium]|nr:PTS transporter subunit EIIA [Pseudomonadota bacterium]
MKTILGIVRLSLFFLIFFSDIAFASNGSGPSESLSHQMVNFVFQLGVILFAARIGGMVFQKINMPSVLGELTIGMLLSPYLLGSLALPGFPHGLFPLISGSVIPVSPSLYGLATIASILLLFNAGLETDFSMLMRYAVAGLVVGIGGVVFSFLAGALTAMYFLDVDFADPRCLFLGVMCTATSVGVTARILTERKKIDSPVGVTVLAGAVIDDIIGIVLLAIVVGIATISPGDGGSTDWGHVGEIAFRAIGVWLFFTAFGLFFANRISSFLKIFKNIQVFSILAFGLALILAGVFEKAGMAMIIGAFVMGLALSKTDLNYVIQDALHPLYSFFVPVFFVIMGMLIDLKVFLSRETLVFGLVFTAGAILSKLLGCGLPALFLKFNHFGALRIGLGMVPRCEVVLIIAGIGLSQGILDNAVFSVAIMMILFTSTLAPLLLNLSFRNPRPGTDEIFRDSELISKTYDFSAPELTELMAEKVTGYFQDEGFFVYRIKTDYTVSRFRKDLTFITMFTRPEGLAFDLAAKDVLIVKTAVYEALVDIHTIIEKTRALSHLEPIKKELGSDIVPLSFDLMSILDKRCISVDLEAENKAEAIEQLVDLLYRNGKFKDKQAVLDAVLERENIISSGMQNGVALPHARTDIVNKIVVAIGISRKGIDFQSIDDKPCRIFIMEISPLSSPSPHLQFLATISSIFNRSDFRERIVRCSDAAEAFSLIKRDCSEKSRRRATASF